jgi:hypothetical protein
VLKQQQNQCRNAIMYVYVVPPKRDDYDRPSISAWPVMVCAVQWLQVEGDF